MKILVINAGSSSLKYQLFDTSKGDVLAKGLCERIGIDGMIKHTTTQKFEKDVPMKDHKDAIKAVIGLLTEGETAALGSMTEIDAVGHRVVHGGENFAGSVLIDDTVLKAIEECIPLAPLHNPPNLTGIHACQEVMGKDVPQVAVFDTAFHQTMPERAYLYALPYEYYETHKVRRYGFHGTSHMYVANEAAKLVGKPISDLKIVTCHLGNGSSITAVNGGKSVDTSMGLTPLEGVPMGTRSGSIDPAILEFIMKAENIDIKEMTNVLNKKSGVLGISGLSSDFRDLGEGAEKGNHRADIAISCFAYAVKKYIGSYAAAMGGIDVLVFTAGVGENDSLTRGRVCEGLDFLGISIDSAKNDTRGTVDISAPGARVKTLVVPTNEELVIANDTERIVSGK
ncbi:acetate kinase [Oscillospiraceae bacterium OttesenSCG-928-G22]|nr:acetate kinase [Oscillospiraceae bacterium OttesenSCG-928-G22]